MQSEAIKRDLLIPEAARRIRAAKSLEEITGLKRWYMVALVSRIETDMIKSEVDATGIVASFREQDQNWKDLCEAVNTDRKVLLSPGEFRRTVKDYDASLAKILGW